MAEQNNIPLSGNYNSNNNPNFDSIVSAITKLSSDMSEIITLLKDQKKAISKSNSIEEKERKELSKVIDKEIALRYNALKSMNVTNNAYKDIKLNIAKFGKEIESQSKSISKSNLGNSTKEIKEALHKLSNEIQEQQMASKDSANAFEQKLAANRKEQLKFENKIREAKAREFVLTGKQQQEEANLIKEYEQNLEDLKTYNKKLQDQRESELALEQAYIEARNKDLQNIENATNIGKELFTKNKDLFKNTNESWAKIKNYINPRQSQEYLQKQADIAATNDDLNDKLYKNQQELDKANISIQEFEDSISVLNAEIAKLEETLAYTTNDDAKKYYEAQKAELVAKKKDHENTKKEHERHKKNLDTERKLLEQDKKLNAEYEKNLKEQTSVIKNLSKSLGDTLGKIISDAVNRQTSLLQSAADKAFDAFESSSKQIAKTLKLSSGQYNNLVDDLISAADKAGLAVDSSQVTELAAALTEQGVRDKDLIATLAVEQAKISETGSNYRLDEEAISAYQTQYFKDIQSGLTQKEALDRLSLNIDKQIATEQAIAETFGRTDALTQGGYEEIRNLTTTLSNMGELTSETSGDFASGMAVFAQAVKSVGADSSLFLSDINSILNTPDGDLSADLLSIVNNLGGNREGFIKKLAESPNEIMSQMASIYGSRYGNLNATNLAYKLQGYNSSYNTTQMASVVNDPEYLAKSISKGLSISNADIADQIETINTGLEKGTYLTATEKMEKKQIDAMDDIARIYQKVADGKYWMDNTFEAGKSLVSLLASALAGLIGGGVSGGLGKLFGGGAAGAGATGAKGSTLKKILSGKSTGVNTALGIGGLAVGTYGFAKSLAEGDDITEAFQNRTFTSGLGMALGGAVGGPIGAAVGAAVGSKVTDLSEKLESWVTKDTEAEAQRAVLKEMKEAGIEVQGAATELYNAAAEQIQATITEKQSTEDWTELQKSMWLKQNGISIETLENEQDVNEAFKKYYTEYFEKQIAVETAKANVSALGSSSVGKQLGKYSTISQKLSKLPGATDEQVYAELSGAYSNEKVIADLHNAGLNYADWNTAVEDYMKSNSITDREVAQAAILKSWGIEDTATQSLFTSAMGTWSDDYNFWKHHNSKFQDKWNTVKSTLGENASVMDIIRAYKEKYNVDLLNDGIINMDSAYNLLDEHGNITNTPILSTADGRYSKYRFMEVDADGIATTPKYKIGLDYVPRDNYLATLHKGETVLTAQEAQEYRSNINFDSITSTLVAQTDRIENILNKILTAITYIGRGGSNTTLSSNIVNMMSGIATI